MEPDLPVKQEKKVEAEPEVEAEAIAEIEPKAQANSKLLIGALFVIISLGFGYIGGSIASNNEQLASNNSEVNTKVVQSQGEAIAKVAADVSPSVVSINVESTEVSNNYYYGNQEYVSQSAGTGIILNEDGLIVTNRHVIPENTTDLVIVLSDGTEYDDIEILGRDSLNDIAFLKINGGKDLKPAKLGDSSKAKVGDAAVAIGNALGRFDTTVTSGIISGLGRPVQAGSSSSDTESLVNLIQTDAAINPGNSGGPLLNIAGEVVGINTAVAGGTAQNIGFAIPINDVKPGIVSVEKNGRLVRPYLGVRYIILNEEIAKELEVGVNQGAYVSGDAGQQAVIKGSPADDAGLKEGDVILKVNDTEITEDNTLVTVIGQYQVGDQVKLTIFRDGKEQTLDVTLEEIK